MYMDADFQELLDNELFSYLQSFNEYLHKVDFKSIESLEVHQRKFSTQAAILDRADLVYSWLRNEEKRNISD